MKFGSKLILTAALLSLLLTLLSSCGESKAQAKDVPLDTIMTNIRDAYGDSYIPDGDIPEEMLSAQYGLAAEMYDDIRAEMAMISMFPDTVIVVKAKEGQADNVESALNTARENAINNTLQYPMNIPKTNATQVVRNGDYVAFLMVGANGEFEDAQSEDAAQFARDETQKGVDAFQKSFAVNVGSK